jgi:trans-aconitate methyltransferase
MDYGRYKSWGRHGWLGSQEYIDFWAGEVIGSLELDKETTFLDIGCGNGHIIKNIAERVDPAVKWVGLDPEGSGKTNHPNLEFKNVPLSEWEEPVDCILIKQAIHHLGGAFDVYEKLESIMNPWGLCMVLTAPKCHYPSFPILEERYKACRDTCKTIGAASVNVGLRTILMTHNYPVEIPRDEYIDMIRARYLSTLHSMSDAEIEAGVEHIKRVYDDPIKFNDKLYSIISYKSRPQ